LDFLGHYNPLTSPVDVKLDAEKVRKWLSLGAEPTDTVRSLIKQHLA
jgi:small subunit ribosomal protein S16